MEFLHPIPDPYTRLPRRNNLGTLSTENVFKLPRLPWRSRTPISDSTSSHTSELLASEAVVPSSVTLTYSKLNKDSIRVLILQPGVGSAPIRCHLQPAKADRSDYQDYEALSYMWGPAEPSKTIAVDWASVQVGENLWNALSCLRLREQTRTLWVDALCINQNDISERNHQVGMMSRIYRAAVRVVVWLGMESKDTRAAFDIIAFARRLLSRCAPSAPLTTREMKAVLALSYRDYWKRVWIIQEVLSASEVQIVCGTKSMPGKHFAETMRRLRQRSPSRVLNVPDAGEKTLWILRNRREALRHNCGSSPAAIILEHYVGPHGVYSIDHLLELCHTCQSQCRDIRDRIYGVLSLARYLGGQVEPDYSASLSEVCLDVFAASLDPLSAVERKSLVGFVQNLQSLLEDPFWDKDLGAFHPLHRVVRTFHLKIYTKTWKLEVKCSSKIVQISPMIRPDNFSHTVQYLIQDWRFEQNQAEQLESIIEGLEQRQFHRTEYLNAQYILDKANNHFKRQFDSIEAEDANNSLRKRSSGRCRTFLTADGGVGLASHKIEMGDQLCTIDGIDNLHIIVRPGREDVKLVLIGRALLLLPGLEERFLSSFNLRTRSSGKLFSKDIRQLQLKMS